MLARLAVDGKVLRGSGRTDGKTLQLFSAAVSHRPRRGEVGGLSGSPGRSPAAPVFGTPRLLRSSCRRLNRHCLTPVSADEMLLACPLRRIRYFLP